MSESAVILEGEVARRFNPVDKLRATNQDSSVSDWVPADTLDLGSLMASENTLYLANIDDDCDAYEEVEVDVSTDLEDADDETKNTHKITGKGQDGNDYAVSVDGDGNLTTEMVPAAIHIVVPPRKRKYLEGETLDFSGIHVYLMDGNNHRYTDSNYPTGEIPFDELVFPVTTAEGEGGSEYLDRDGTINAVMMSSSLITDEYGGVYRTPSVIYTAPSTTGAPHPGVYFGAMGEATWLLTRYNNNLYAMLLSGSESISFLKMLHYLPGDSWYWYGSAHSQKTVQNTFTNVGETYLEEQSQWFVPLSTKDPEGHTYDEMTVQGYKIPVQWMRSDGKTLEDMFEIEIVSEEQPVPEPEPDPWGGYADVSWGGHHYNFNRRLVPPVQYSNGYCWRQQAGEYTVEYTVEQAANMGWLILIR